MNILQTGKIGKNVMNTKMRQNMSMISVYKVKKRTQNNETIKQ